MPYQHDAVVWQIQAQLEKSLVAPFEPDYAKRLAEARQKIRNAS